VRGRWLVHAPLCSSLVTTLCKFIDALKACAIWRTACVRNTAFPSHCDATIKSEGSRKVCSSGFMKALFKERRAGHLPRAPPFWGSPLRCYVHKCFLLLVKNVLELLLVKNVLEKLIGLKFCFGGAKPPLPWQQDCVAKLQFAF